MTTEPPVRVGLALGVGLALVALGCSVRSVDPETLPADLRSAYALFESRCSKCHTIARPLNAPVRDATHWELYVARMRRTPGSGISERDATEILRFLVHYTTVIRRHDGNDDSEDDETISEDSAGDEAGPSGDALPPASVGDGASQPSGDDASDGIVFEEEADDAASAP